MSKYDVLKMLKESGIEWYGKHVDPDGNHDVWKGDLEQFAHLLAAHIAEECAKVCEKKSEGWKNRIGKDISLEYVRIALIASDQIAASIRSLYKPTE